MENNIVYSTKLHWSYYIFPLVFILTIYLSPIGIYFILYYRYVKIELNDKSFSYKYGLLNRKQIDIKLEKIESIRVQRNIIDMIFGSGTIIVSGTGGNNEPIKGVDKPFELKEAIENAIV